MRRIAVKAAPSSNLIGEGSLQAAEQPEADE
jgi:hypothetical protein